MTPDTPKHFLPSIPAAMVAGAVVMPIFALGWKHIEKGNFHPLVLPGWWVIGFFLPVMITTVDFRYLANTSETFADYFRSRCSADDFRQFYVPSWLRMICWFVSAACAMLILTVFGMQF